MAQIEQQLPSPPQRFGCMDKQALNYDSLATMPCSVSGAECCEYPEVNIVGCIDPLAYNTNPDATVQCEGCCRYFGTGLLVGIGGIGVVLPEEPKFPYDLSLESTCVRDSGYQENWTYSEGNSTFYNDGYRQYLKDFFTATGSYVPNGFTSLTQIEDAFNNLLLHKPNSRVFYNNIGFTPWIIPLYSNYNPNVTNPNLEKFISDCENRLGGKRYIYEEAGDTILQVTQLELIETKTTLKEQQQNLDDWNVWRSTRKWVSPEEQAVGDALQTTVKQTNNTIQGLQSEIKILTNSDVVTTSVKAHFVACLCETDVVDPSPCKTTTSKGDVIPIRLGGTMTGDNGDLHQQSHTGARCITTAEEYFSMLGNQRNAGWGTTYAIPTNIWPQNIQTSFFNTFLLEQLGVTNPTFVMLNVFNTTTTDWSGNPIPNGMTGAGYSKLLIKNAFLAGGNVWLPTHHSIAMDIITSEECCKIVNGPNGIFTQGSYTTGRGKNESLGHMTGVCQCKPVSQPCPSIADGEVEPITEVIETRQGRVTTTYVKVSEECCSNTLLQSKMPGNWTWDPITMRCVLIGETNECNTDTIITISETPISTSGIDCVDDIITISTYMYFEEPSNLCTGGVSTEGQPKPLTEDTLTLYTKPPKTIQEISRFGKNNYSENLDFDDRRRGIRDLSEWQHQGPTPVVPSNKCCYDTDNPIEGQLVLLDNNNQKITTNNVTQIDTFLSQVTTLNTNTNVGVGFGRWVKLTTTAETTNLVPFSVAVEFPTGLFKCCEYDIYFDDLEVGCLQPGIRQIHNTEKCPGFELRHVIDNKKSWVYNPGKAEISDDVNDNIIRGNGTTGMNIAQSNPHIIDGGHGAINRVFAPSVDAELPFRDTDYFGFHGVIERHSKLVLNSKEVRLTFNMCPDGDCVINPDFLIDDNGDYILDDDGGRIVVGPYTPFPNLVQLETFKKTFQGFWVQFMEQFIPATTIFISGEKWCNSRICSEFLVADYLLDTTNDDGILSPSPVSENIIEPINPLVPNVRSQPLPVRQRLGSLANTPTGGKSASSGTSDGPIILGGMKIYDLESLTPHMGEIRTRVLTP